MTPEDKQLDLGLQPLDQIMLGASLSNHDLVEASSSQLTHKMVTRGRKGRRLKRKVQLKILEALNARMQTQSPDTHRVYTLPDIFNYKGLF